MLRSFLCLFFFVSSYQFGNAQKEKFLEKSYYENGNLQSIGYSLEGLLEDAYVEFDSLSGDTTKYYNYHKGEKHGEFMVRQFTNYYGDRLNKAKAENKKTLGEVISTYGNYVDGNLHGDHKSYYENGQLFMQSTFKEGQRVGETLSFYEQGTLRSKEFFVDGELDGIWNYYYESGNLKEERIYRNGEVVNSVEVEWYENGRKKNFNSYVSRGGKKVQHGPSAVFYETGTLQTESFYSNGKPDRVWKGFYPNGKLKYEMFYEDTVYKSYVEYDENGQKK